MIRSIRSAKLHAAILFTLLAGLAIAPNALKAQDSSSITGQVTDATGAALSGAVVTLSNPTTGQKYTATTDKT